MYRAGPCSIVHTVGANQKDALCLSPHANLPQLFTTPPSPHTYSAFSTLKEMPNLIQKQNHQESCSFYGEKCACSGSVKLKALERAFCPAPHHVHLASSATGWELTNSLHGLILQTCTPAKRGLLMETLCLHSPERAAREEPAPRAALGTWLASSEPSAWHRREGSSSTASLAKSVGSHML